jgi:hypothetical protein
MCRRMSHINILLCHIFQAYILLDFDLTPDPCLVALITLLSCRRLVILLKKTEATALSPLGQERANDEEGE